MHTVELETLAQILSVKTTRVASVQVCAGHRFGTGPTTDRVNPALLLCPVPCPAVPRTPHPAVTACALPDPD